MNRPTRRVVSRTMLAAAVLVGAACASESPLTIEPDPSSVSSLRSSTTESAGGATTSAVPPTTTTGPTPTTTPTTTTTTTTATTTTTTTTTTTSTTTTVPLPPSTSCTDVAHIGDSTGVYLWEGQYVDGAANTMGERYLSVGVERWVEDNSGGRSIRERTADWQTNALEVADAIRQSGFDGCWVVMIGTNDAANVASGASLGLDDRILRMLFVFGDDPVLWVDAATTRSGTGYANVNMQAWNEALLRVTADRPNVEVLRWSEVVQPNWFMSDGIHMTTEGRVWRAAITAAALLDAFPA